MPDARESFLLHIGAWKKKKEKKTTIKLTERENQSTVQCWIADNTWQDKKYWWCIGLDACLSLENQGYKNPCCSHFFLPNFKPPPSLHTQRERERERERIKMEPFSLFLVNFLIYHIIITVLFFSTILSVFLFTLHPIASYCTSKSLVRAFFLGRLWRLCVLPGVTIILYTRPYSVRGKYRENTVLSKRKASYWITSWVTTSFGAVSTFELHSLFAGLKSMNCGTTAVMYLLYDISQ